MAEQSKLGEIYKQAAEKCRAQNIPLDAEPWGAIHRWALQNCKMREGTEFFIVQGIAAAMADLDAQAEGFTDQLDRAAAGVDWSKAKQPPRGAYRN